MIEQYLSNTNESDTVSIFQNFLKTKPKSIIKSVQTPKQVERYLLVLEFGWSAMTFFTSDESEAHQNRTYQQRHIHHIPWAHPAIRPPELNEAGPCQDSLSHRIFGRMYGALNIDKNKTNCTIYL